MPRRETVASAQRILESAVLIYLQGDPKHWPPEFALVRDTVRGKLAIDLKKLVSAWSGNYFGPPGDCLGVTFANS